MKIKDTVIAIFAVALIGGLAWLWLAPAGLQRAPEVTFTTIDGRKLSIAGLRGKPVLVNFWATTCPGCVKEMPHLVELYKELNPQGFEIIGVAMAYDPPNQVVALSKARNINYPIALDIQNAAAMAFGDVRLTPTSFLVAPDGRIVHQKIGELDISKLRTLILEMLAQAGTSSPTIAAR
ncbi:TlpA disulfide reductase family protein [Pseudomonadota bacterium]